MSDAYGAGPMILRGAEALARSTGIGETPAGAALGVAAGALAVAVDPVGTVVSVACQAARDSAGR